jgi:hypothetical protein
MTKAGSNPLPDQTRFIGFYQPLQRLIKSASSVIEQGVMGVKPLSSEAHVLSGPYYEPIK